ncbi:hypothetical protein [Streptomyces luteolus]|uniref:LysR substrate-binding domain-containing protein n=1 Tax=Streptomyces luteolus TaxID=3043615 RepID=A0ABT6T2Y5_9ACTN|nr:hypothetical protein [Streptomyces sp. B-S-A12]MDI3422011.1 hypothetical protein [Streptomyces sp. B-S-A12]
MRATHRPTVSGVEGMLPATARHLFPRPGVRYVDVPDLLPSTAALAWHRDRAGEPAVAALAEAARAVPARGTWEQRGAAHRGT